MICKTLKSISFKLWIKKKYKLMNFSLKDSLGSSFYSFELLKDQKKNIPEAILLKIFLYLCPW